MKQTKNILNKLMLATAPFAVAATVASTNVMANADSNSVGNWDMTPAEQVQDAKANQLAQETMKDNGTIGKASDEAVAKRTAEIKADDDKSFAQIKKETAAYVNKKTPTKKAAAKKVTKKHVAKKKAAKKTTKKHVKKATKKHVAKKVAKKRVVKKHAKKHARRLFRIRVKAHRIYAYKTIAMHKAGRRAEVKGTKLYVYGTARRHGRTYYKVYGHHWITSAHKYVARV